MASVCCVIMLSGFEGFCRYKFSLSDTVLSVFITTTTINVIGVFYIVAKWLFPLKEFSLKE